MISAFWRRCILNDYHNLVTNGVNVIKIQRERKKKSLTTGLHDESAIVQLRSRRPSSFSVNVLAESLVYGGVCKY